MDIDTLLFTDGAAGNRRQAEALAEALGRAAAHHEVRWSAPWSWLAPRFTPGAHPRLLAAIEAARPGTMFDVRTPALAIGCGRAGALATRVMRRPPTRTIQILDPRADARHWDIVIAPEHDGLAGANVVTTIGAVHAITDAKLAGIRDANPELASDPRVMVAIGGSNRAQRVDRDYVESLIAMLDAKGIERAWITTSRRTDPALFAPLSSYAGRTHATLYFAGVSREPNPYFAFLACARSIIVTPDSVNLATEACATGRPVYVHAPDAIGGKIGRFHARLRTDGYTRALVDYASAWNGRKLDEMPRVVAEVRARLALD